MTLVLSEQIFFLQTCSNTNDISRTIDKYDYEIDYSKLMRKTGRVHLIKFSTFEQILTKINAIFRDVNIKVKTLAQTEYFLQDLIVAKEVLCPQYSDIGLFKFYHSKLNLNQRRWGQKVYIYFLTRFLIRCIYAKTFL